MDLEEKIRALPTRPGVYLYKNADDEVIYVGKAKNLRSRVRSYLLEASQANAKTGSLMREAVDVDYILVDNEHEALALENNLIKQRKPRFNILLRDDKTYPYVKLTLGDRYPKVFVTRRLRKDGSAYYGPLFSGQPGVSDRRADSPELSAAELQGGPVAVSSAAVPAVLHQALSWAVRGGADDSGGLSRGGAEMRRCFSMGAARTWRSRSKIEWRPQRRQSSSSWRQSIVTCW